MVRKPDIEYIDKYYVQGSEAKVIAFVPDKRTPKTTLPKSFSEKKTSIEVDPIALCGLVVAVVMLVVMALGMVDFKAACEENQAMAGYLQELRDDNVMKQYTYHSSYDPVQVEEAAKVLGMVPVSEIPVVTLSVTVPEAQETYTPWGDFLWSLSCLFAE